MRIMKNYFNNLINLILKNEPIDIEIKHVKKALKRYKNELIDIEISWDNSDQICCIDCMFPERVDLLKKIERVEFQLNRLIYKKNKRKQNL